VARPAAASGRRTPSPDSDLRQKNKNREKSRIKTGNNYDGGEDELK